jgi:hypothetical protein
MNGPLHRIFSLPLSATAILLASCSTLAPQATPSVRPSAAHSPTIASVPKVAGTYAGTWKQTGGGGPPESGTVTIAIAQSGSKVSGTIAAKYKTKTNKMTFTGTVKSGAHGAQTQLIVKGPYNDGKGSATVVKSTLSGKVVFPAHAGKSKLTVTFSAKKG